LTSGRTLRQGEHLKEGAVEGEQILIDEGIAGSDIVVDAEADQGAELIVAVVREPMAIGDQDQEHIKQALLMSEVNPEAIAQKPMFNESEAPLDLSHPLRDQEFFVNHRYSPFHGEANTTVPRGTIESSFAIIGRGD
jgi:hypothetical protein